MDTRPTAGAVSTTYRVLIVRDNGRECPADPECYFVTHDECVQLIDQVIDAERRWPHQSELRTIEITAVQAWVDPQSIRGRQRPFIPLDQLPLFPELEREEPF